MISLEHLHSVFGPIWAGIYIYISYMHKKGQMQGVKVSEKQFLITYTGLYIHLILDSLQSNIS